jgi:hypothetical protein
MDQFTCIQNVVGYETHVLTDDDKPQLNRRELCIVLLDVTVKYLQQFGVNQMKVFANHNADFVRFHRDNVDDLLDNLVPNQLRVASQERDVDLVVNVADVVLVCVFLILETYLLVMFEFAWAVFVDCVEHLGVLAHTGRAVKNQIRQVVQIFGEFREKRDQFRVQIIIVHRSQVFVEMGFVIFHYN